MKSDSTDSRPREPTGLATQAARPAGWRSVLHRWARWSHYNSSMWSGDYPDWDAANKACRVTTREGQRHAYEHAVNAVLNGEALFERDSILHHRPIACWPLLFALRDLQSRGRSVPSVIDLGGGLGSLYFQHRSWWTATHPVDWNVVELPEIAADGRRLIQEPGLRFFDSLEDAVHEHPPDLVVVASLLAMVPNPEAMMDSLGVLDCRWVFIDRVPVTDRKGRHLIARQVVPSAIYESESPFWFFDESKLRQLLSVHFVIEGQSTSDCDDPAWVEGHLYQWRGYLLRHRRTSP